MKIIPIMSATGFINENFNMSSDNLTLYYDGKKESIGNPGVLVTLEDFDRHMKASLPDIYKTSNSIINVSKMPM